MKIPIPIWVQSEKTMEDIDRKWLVVFDGKTTMTVAGLKHYLEQFPEELPVFAEWEDYHAPILADNMFIHLHNGYVLIVL